MVGNVLYPYVVKKVGEKGPKVTGMLIDLPVDDLKVVMQDYSLFCTRVNQAVEMLEQHKDSQAEKEKKEEGKSDPPLEENFVVEKKKDSKAEKSKAEFVRVSILKRMTLTDEQKERIRKVYEQIVHVHFAWGGEGFIQVSRFYLSLIPFLFTTEVQNKVADNSVGEDFARLARNSADHP